MKIERKIREEVIESLKVIGITLLSVEEYMAAKAHIMPINGWWWLRSPGFDSNLAAIVDYFGRVISGGISVDITNNVVRPALLIQNLNFFKLKPGDRILNYAKHGWTVISDTMALCDDGIGKHCFREDWEAQDANDYEKSDVKRFLESWAAKNGIICRAKMEEQDGNSNMDNSDMRGNQGGSEFGTDRNVET